MSERTKLRTSVCLGLCLLACLLFLSRATRRTAAAPAIERRAALAESTHSAHPSPKLWHVSHASMDSSAPHTQEPPPQGDKPVEQTRKNIQILKGLPESQLFPVMNFVSASLGVKCDFCHVKQGKDPKTGFDNWVWESDDKQEKKTTRNMMRMVLAVNNGDFGMGQGTVTCYTCHRGQEHPVNIPPLPLTTSGHEPGPAVNAGAPKPAAPPTVEQVLNKYADAVGGRAAVAKLQTGVFKGTREASQNRNFPIEVTMFGPDKYLVMATTPRGVVQQAVNGDTGWVKNAQGVRAFTPAEVSEFKHSISDMFRVIKIGEASTGMRVRGRTEKIGDREAWVVIKRSDAWVARYYFDKETGLLLREYTLTNTMLNPIPEQIDYEDYRDVNGVKVPFTIRLSEIDTFNSATRKYSEIKFNVPVDDKLLQMPAAAPPK